MNAARPEADEISFLADIIQSVCAVLAGHGDERAKVTLAWHARTAASGESWMCEGGG
jgi:hypothetical protein